MLCPESDQLWQTDPLVIFFLISCQVSIYIYPTKYTQILCHFNLLMRNKLHPDLSYI